MDSTRKYKVLITAGPTREYLDPVRYLTNESSGKMGYAIAEEMEARGAEVILISGPVALPSPIEKGKTIHVKTAKNMLEAVLLYAENVDAAIFCAAVADYKPVNPSAQKIKKTDQFMEVLFEKNPDIAFEFGRLKNEKQFSIGFALETEHILEHAKSKMNKKNFDMIVMNSAVEKGAGFGCDTNIIRIMEADGTIHNYNLKPKKDVAKDIIDRMENVMNLKQNLLII